MRVSSVRFEGSRGEARDDRARRGAPDGRSARARRRGFTMIELMMSLAVMTIGAAALFSLQGFIARANLYSRRVAQATEIADKWVERLKTDALLWNAQGATGMGGTTYLNEITTSPDAWRQAAGNLENHVNTALGHSSGADIFGNDLVPLDNNTQSAIAFCTHYRLNWIVDSATDTSLRAEVRVLWAKEISGAPGSGVSLADNNGITPLCAQTSISTANLHVLTVATIIRYTPP